MCAYSPSGISANLCGILTRKRRQLRSAPDSTALDSAASVTRRKMKASAEYGVEDEQNPPAAPPRCQPIERARQQDRTSAER